jgi:hypothetical protein
MARSSDRTVGSVPGGSRGREHPSNQASRAELAFSGQRQTHKVGVQFLSKNSTSARFRVTSAPYSDTKLAAGRKQAAVQALCKYGRFAVKDGFRRSAGAQDKRRDSSENYTSVHINRRFFLPPTNLSERVAWRVSATVPDEGAHFQ